MENQPKEELATSDQIDVATKEWSDAMKAINELKKESEINKIKMIAVLKRYRMANETIRALKIDY